ncbi:MAG: recombinase family protein [Planctomyces sp.]
MPERAATVKRIFNLYASGGHTFKTLLDLLYDEGHTVRQSQKRFHRSALACILNNRFYIGELHRHGQVYAGRYERLIDQDIFDQCQNILHGRNRRTRHQSSDRPLERRPKSGEVQTPRLVARSSIRSV